MENQAENTNQKTARERGLFAISTNQWMTALIELNQALREGQTDILLLDAFGEAAYRANVPEALGPYQNYYKYPSIASHMARAFLMLGDTISSKEFLGYAKDSALKSALNAMLELGTEISATAAQVLPVAENFPDLYYPEYWRALAPVSDAVGRDDLTKLSERKSKAFAYKDPNIHFNQALRMLGKGEFRAGWRLYEWRLVPNASQSNRTELGHIPMWEGEKLTGKTLLICLEQGLGDGIFSLRYISILLQQAKKIEIIARPAIIPLIQSSFPEIKIYNEDEIVVVGYWDTITDPADYWVYGLSIPYRASLWQPMNTKKFLSAPTTLTKEISLRIQKLNTHRLSIYTINWHGRIDTESDRTRAFSVTEFCTVTGIDQKPSVIISLQKDATPEELDTLENLVKKTGGIFINAAPELTDFAVTAAWIAASDCLLTCDTSVAHVGGALGHPTTVFARNKAIWQWLRKDKSGTENISPAVWYENVQVQYALAPKISWLFTTINQSKEVGHDKTRDRNSNNDSEKITDLSTKEIRPAGQRGKFRFAGRPE